jgi:hypothetical protein
MFALQDLVDDEDLENISAVEKEGDSPFFWQSPPPLEKRRGPVTRSTLVLIPGSMAGILAQPKKSTDCRTKKS